MAARRKVANPLALAVMGLLQEKPMHPYEMAATLRERQMETAFKVTTGTLYSTVESLARKGWIAPHATARQGNRPQRTVYTRTDLGEQEFLAWLDTIIRTPAPEYPVFLSAVAYLGALGRDGARNALTERAEHLRQQIKEARTDLERVASESGLPRLYLIEVEYALHMSEAELAWTTRTLDDIRTGALPWPKESP